MIVLEWVLRNGLKKSLEERGRNLVLSPPVGVSPTKGIVTPFSLRPSLLVPASTPAGTPTSTTVLSATSAWTTSTFPGSTSLATPELRLVLGCGEAAPVGGGREILC